MSAPVASTADEKRQLLLSTSGITPANIEGSLKILRDAFTQPPPGPITEGELSPQEEKTSSEHGISDVNVAPDQSISHQTAEDVELTIEAVHEMGVEIEGLREQLLRLEGNRAKEKAESLTREVIIQLVKETVESAVAPVISSINSRIAVDAARMNKIEDGMKYIIDRTQEIRLGSTAPGVIPVDVAAQAPSDLPLVSFDTEPLVSRTVSGPSLISKPSTSQLSKPLAKEKGKAPAVTMPSLATRGSQVAGVPMTVKDQLAARLRARKSQKP